MVTSSSVEPKGTGLANGWSLGGWFALLLSPFVMAGVGHSREPAAATSTNSNRAPATIAARPTSVVPPISATPPTAATPPTSSAVPSSPPPVDEPSSYCLGRFLEPWEGLAFDDRSQPQRENVDWHARLEAAVTRASSSSGPDVEVGALIATVPDPIDSGLGYLFDTTLQAIRLGVEARVESHTSLYRDLSWLPWQDSDDPEANQRLSEGCRQQLPGLVLFRGAAGVPSLTALLLVGETASTGVHRGAMMRALEIADVLTRNSSGASRNATAILGPTFSGSAASLRATLQRWSLRAHGHRKVTIVTGSATGGSLRSSLVSDGSPNAWFSNGQVEFWSTTVREAELQCRYLHRIAPGVDKGIKPAFVDSVALLHESGTEFGSTLTGQGPVTGDAKVQQGCLLSAGVDVSFPAQISAVRDAYEAMDRGTAAKDPLARRTTLDISLRGQRRPLGIDAEPAPMTTFARDIALSRALSAVADSTIRHVVIQATDVADAIFLARKVRDVAPDVRLAFLKSDVLLLHRDYRSMLEGSLVVTPYPFLGASDFAAPVQPRTQRGFENSLAEGIFNATLVLRGAKPSELREYVAPQGGANLPIWVATIGNGRFVPLAVLPNHVPKSAQDELDDVVFPGPDGSAGSFKPDTQRFTDFRPKTAMVAWRDAALPLHRERSLLLASQVALPRLWRFLLLAVSLLFCADRVLHRSVRRSLSDAGFPKRIEPSDDRDADRAIVRTKWRFYAAIRSGILLAAYGYLASFWALGLFLNESPPRPLDWVYIAMLALGSVVAAGYCFKDALAFLREYASYGVSAGCRRFPLQWTDLRRAWVGVRKLFGPKAGRDTASTPPLQHSPEEPPPAESVSLVLADADDPDRWDRTTLPLGLARSESRISPARLSFAQLRLLTAIGLVLVVGFTVAQLRAVSETVESMNERSQVLLTLVVHRTLQLADGASAGAPTLAFLGVIYVWAIGRMGRLRLAHGLSQLSPSDGIADLVSTPIRLVLYPNHTQKHAADDSFTRVERRAVNTILRPITGPKYCAALLVVLVLPLAIFSISPIATLEQPLNPLLLCLHYLCSVLIGNTLIQLFQYWMALERLLKGVLGHPLGRAFSRVRPFVRESIHEQVSRTPNDLLRLAACASEFDSLVRWGKRLRDSIIEPSVQAAFDKRLLIVKEKRQAAICASNTRNIERATRCAEALGEEVIAAARQVMQLVWSAWEGKLPDTRQPPSIRKLRSLQRSLAPASALPMASGDASRQAAPNPSFELPTVPPVLAGPMHAEPARAVSASNSLGPAVPASAELEQATDAEDWRYSEQELTWLRDAEAFAATVVAVLINRHVRQLQYFVYTLLGCSLFLMAAAMSYPFEPHRLLSTWVWGFVLVAIGAGLWTYLELDRNTLLSRIASSDAGKLTFDRGLALRVLAWGVAPLVAAAATEYPDLVNSIFRFVSLGSGN
jgi:hypothetical protein